MSGGISKSLSQQITIISNVEDSLPSMSPADSCPINSNPFTVKENGVDVTASATITHSVSGPSENCSVAGDYTITYTVKYDGETDTAKTTITVKSNEPPTPPTNPSEPVTP